MKILWAGTNFLHPTTKGGQIRTLEMLRRLHRRHEIHYVAVEDPRQPGGPAGAPEYSARAYPFRHRFPDKRSPLFAARLVKSLADELPVALSRFHVPALHGFLETLIARERFDRAVVDFLNPATYFPRLERSLLFQHNVETVIWRRLAANARDPLRRWYFGIQAERMFRFEARACRAAGHVAAVSETDARAMRELFGVACISAVPTGVDVESLTPPAPLPPRHTDLVFVGSMDWGPNIDGIRWFVEEVLPRVRRVRPGAALTIVGRTPPRSIADLGERDRRIRVTGTVPDIRPHLWGAAVSIVPLRVGGGTRLKIYESMAARVAVVSTAVGAEGLDVLPGENIGIADSAEAFAEACLELLADRERRERQAAAAWEMVAARMSWEHVACRFEEILERTPGLV